MKQIMQNYEISWGKLLNIWKELNGETINWSLKNIKSLRQIIQSDWISN